MNPDQLIQRHFNESAETARATAQALGPQIARAVSKALRTLEHGGKILICGNGGSASDAQHFAAELVCRYELDRQALAALSLTSDSAVLTASGNDYDFSKVFSRQIEALGQAKDLLVAITTSGKSKNIELAVEKAMEMGISVVALTGKDGGTLAPIIAETGIELRVPSDVTARVQEAHAIIIHCMCNLIEMNLKGKLSL